MHTFVIKLKRRMDYIEDRHEYYNVYISKCTQCKHFNFDKLKCPAYPNGIPVKYLDGSQVHDKKKATKKGVRLPKRIQLTSFRFCITPSHFFGYPFP